MADLIQNAGHPTFGMILGGRPFAEPGIYSPSAVVTNLCDWFDPEAPATWAAAEAAAEFTSAASGGWKTPEAAADFTSPAAGGWRGKKPCA